MAPDPASAAVVVPAAVVVWIPERQSAGAEEADFDGVLSAGSALLRQPFSAPPALPS